MSDGALGWFITCAVLVIVGGILCAFIQDRADRYHTEACTWRYEAAKTARDSALVLRADSWCVVGARRS